MEKKSTSGIMIVDRATGELQAETVFGDGTLRFVYETLLGRTFWGLLFNTSCLSGLLGSFYDSSLSKKSIRKLAMTPGCDPSEASLPVEEYKNFNAFFTRHLKDGARPFDFAPDKISSPADGRLFVYEGLKPCDPIPVKGAKRTLNELCCRELPEGPLSVAVARLAPVDYHRYHFPCSCDQAEPPHVFRGKYHSVNPVALVRRPDLYVENTRQITMLESDLFGVFHYIEVGAFGVGSIVQTSSPGYHEKMAEKGLFKFGGSTVILIFDGNRVKWDSDLLENTRAGHETRIVCGETIGSRR